MLLLRQFLSVFDDLELKTILKAYFTTLQTDFVDFYFLKNSFLDIFANTKSGKKKCLPPGFEPTPSEWSLKNLQLGICGKNQATKC